jgi:predicted TIM-barrel fold metal-dependent hydrolase
MLELAVHEIPADRILFGSCAPELDARVAMESMRLLHPRSSRDIFVAPSKPVTAGLTPEQKQKIMGGNILKLLKI